MPLKIVYLDDITKKKKKKKDLLNGLQKKPEK